MSANQAADRSCIRTDADTTPTTPPRAVLELRRRARTSTRTRRATDPRADDKPARRAPTPRDRTRRRIHTPHPLTELARQLREKETGEEAAQEQPETRDDDAES